MKDYLKNNKLNPSDSVNNYLISINSTPIKDGISLYDLLKRPEITYKNIEKYYKIDYDEEIKEETSIQIKYEGYIKKAQIEAEKMLKYENQKIPDNIDYKKIKNIASEARQKLEEVRPTSIGQAIRISGVNPPDISILSVYIKKEYKNDIK